MRALLDTCVISELRRPQGEPRVRAAVARLEPDALYLSVVVLGELVRGVERLPGGRKRRELAAWLTTLETTYADRILPIDVNVARLWGEVTGTAQSKGHNLPVADGLVAATALRHGLHLFTRNVTDFAHSGARVFNPWTD